MNARSPTLGARGASAGRGSTEARMAAAALPGIVVAYMLVILIPIEMSFYAGPLFITPTRLFLLVTAIPLLAIMAGRGGLNRVDGLMAVYVVWIMLAFLAKRGPGGIEAAGQSFLEVTVSYLVARLFLREPGQVVRLLMLASLCVLVLGFLAIPEGVLHQRFLHDIPRAVTGIYYEMQSDTRIGLLRSASVFENPILFGLYCATFLSMVWYSTLSLGARLGLCGGIFMATGLSLSSAPILLLVMQVGLISAEHATRRIEARVPIIVGMIVAFVVLVEALTNRGVARLIASYLTFNPATGYYRLLQWEFSIDDVRRNPLFGINFENWTRPWWLNDSIDNHWLYLAMNSGVPAVLAMWSCLGLLAYRLYRRRKGMRDPVLSSLMLGWIIGMAALFMGGWTVTLFGKMLPVFHFLVGIGAALMVMDDLPEEDGAVEEPPPETGRYSRFVPRPRQGLVAPPAFDRPASARMAEPSPGGRTSGGATVHARGRAAPP